MRIVNVFFYYYEGADKNDLPKQYYTTTGWAEALQAQGATCMVITRFGEDGVVEERGMQWHCVKDALKGSLRAWQIPLHFMRQIKALDADVVHLHSFSMALQTFVLRLLLPRKTAIVMQHHGGKSPGKAKRLLYNILNSVADGFFFTTAAQGEEWFMKRRRWRKLLPVMEGATYFDYDSRDMALPLRYQDRAAARLTTGMHGSPVFLWVGRLDTNKDPLTVLAGFSLLLQQYPQAKLYMIYSGDELLSLMQAMLDRSTLLRQQVHLLGTVPHESMLSYYNSADYFVLGSHYEGSGYALSEALRCGCVPVITDIPSFRMMTDDGRLGALWQPDDVGSFVAAAVSALQKPLPAEATACIDHFQQALSFEAIGRTALSHYEQLMMMRQL